MNHDDFYVNKNHHFSNQRGSVRIQMAPVLPILIIFSFLILMYIFHAFNFNSRSTLDRFDQKACKQGVQRSHLTSQNIGNFLAKSTTLVIAGVMIFVNWLKASKSTLPPSGALTIGACPISSG